MLFLSWIKNVDALFTCFVYIQYTFLLIENHNVVTICNKLFACLFFGAIDDELAMYSFFNYDST